MAEENKNTSGDPPFNKPGGGDKITAASEEQRTGTNKPGTENMDTHAHKLHKAPGSGWKHYFFEFFMLFFAVFCGFLAEYALEHKIEKEKGTKYIHSIYEDLVIDTANFSQLILIYENKIEALKKRNDCYDSINGNIQSSECMKVLFDNSRHFPDLIYTDRTLQQLKNAGGLRLLNKADADSIFLYDNMLRLYVRAETTSFQETQTDIRNTLYNLINYKYVKQQQQKGAVSILFSDNKEILNRYFNELDAYTQYCGDNMEDIRGLKLRATSLINYFKNKYHLE